VDKLEHQSSAPKNFYFTSDMRLEYAVSSTVSKGLVFQSVSGTTTYAVPAQVSPPLGSLAMVDDELEGLIWNNAAKFNGWLGKCLISILPRSPRWLVFGSMVRRMLIGRAPQHLPARIMIVFMFLPI
jgi:hypothetical protein